MKLRPRPRDERTEAVMAKIDDEIARLKAALADLRAQIGGRHV